MRVVLLGSGSSVPQAGRASSGYYLTGPGFGILVDPSAGSSQRLVAAGYEPTEVTAILLTHYHADHVCDLVPLLFSLQNPRYARERWPTVIGPAGVASFFAALRAPFEKWVPGPPEIEVREEHGDFELGDIEAGGVSVSLTPVPHTPVSRAYRFRAGGRTVVISSDTEYSDGLADFARGCDLLFLECTSPDGPIPGHLDPDGARRLIERAAPARTVLVHLNPEWGPEPIPQPLGASFGHPVELGVDGHTY